MEGIDDNKKKRVEWIDLAKGFCMILVVWIHVRLHYRSAHLVRFNWIALVCYYFRMPLYFMLSGLFFKNYGSFGKFFCKKFDNLAIPFLTFAGYAAMRQIVGFYCLGWPDTYYYSHMQTFYPVNTIWFLLALFWLNMVFYAVDRSTVRYRWAMYPLCLALGVAGFYVNVLPFWLHFEVAFTALPFFAFGYFLRQKSTFLKQPPHYILDLVMVAVLFYAVERLADWHHELIQFDRNIYKLPVWALYVGGICGSMAILLLARMIGRLPVISYIGRYSIIVLIAHPIIILQIPCKELADLVGGGKNAVVVETIGILLLCVPIIWFCRRFLPWFFAQKPVLSRRQN